MLYYETRNDLLYFFQKGLTVAEVGVFKGDFSKIIKDVLQPKELHLIDLFSGPMISGDKDGNNIEKILLDPYYENLKQTYSTDKSVFIRKGTSAEILSSYESDYFDFIYIDADHSYEAVKSDLNQSLNKVKFGGYLGGHDFNAQEFPGVYKAVTEFCSSTGNEIICLTNDKLPSFIIKINFK